MIDVLDRTDTDSLLRSELERMELSPFVTSCHFLGHGGAVLISLEHQPVFWEGTLPAAVCLRVGRGSIYADWRPSKRKTKETVLPVGDLTLLPAGAKFAGKIRSAEPVDYIVLPKPVIDQVFMGTAPEFVGNFTDLYLRPFRSKLISALANRLIADAQSEATLGPLYADNLLQGIITELSALARMRAVERSLGTNDLTPLTLDQLASLCDANLTRRIGLEELAKTARMPPTRFARSLKARTGFSPHQFVLERRLIRARTLVETTSLSLAEIAYRSGFSSQSHMTDVFTRRIGTTPGALRRIVR